MLCPMAMMFKLNVCKCTRIKGYLLHESNKHSVVSLCFLDTNTERVMAIVTGYGHFERGFILILTRIGKDENIELCDIVKLFYCVLYS